ncbi:MAG: mannose-1-phosphate guanylyltransferase/mannose-6-phosphate isomerase [Nitrospirota bacterium]
MKAILLAGGSGTRLWPLSRKNYPKQFLKLNGDSSLLQQTVERLLHVLSPQDIIVMTNDNYLFHVKADLKGVYDNPLIILEPVSRNTAPAISLAVKYCVEKLGSSSDEVIFVSPSDHIIKPVERFTEYIRNAGEIAKEGYIVTFGIRPKRPETGYGYIKVRSEKLEVRNKRYDCYKAEKFTEKPDSKTAASYLEGGNYYWNSGMFAFTIGTILEELQKYAPEIYRNLGGNFEEVVSNFVNMPEISIDYAVAEKSNRVVTLPMDIYWDDIGSWDSIYEVLEKDEKGNVKAGDILNIDTKDTLIIGGRRFISTIGLEGLLIVETDDAILIAKRGEAQKVKDVVNELIKENRKLASEHTTTYRPWGSYTVLEEGNRYKIKRIVVNPLERLSLQVHHHRSEHWVVVKGVAKVKIGDKEIFIHENESAYVPKSTLHMLENPGKVPLEIIEVQNGEYVEEDDIVRIEDVYGRS